MKPILALLACVFLATGCGDNSPQTTAPYTPSEISEALRRRRTDQQVVVEGNTAFALDLYGKLRQQPGNLVLSPSSISLALGMTYARARGETERQMASVLHFELSQERLHPALGALALTSAGPDGASTGHCQSSMGQARLFLPRGVPGRHPRSLREMGLTNLHDFRGMSEGGALSLSVVEHGGFISVDEKGTEAAAATAVGIATSAVVRESRVFRADHPFLFLIRHNATKSILFLGRLVRP